MSKVLRRLLHRNAESDAAERKQGEPGEPTSDEGAVEQQIAALMSAWNKASLRGRREFLTRIDQRILTAHRIRSVPPQSG
jgi:hypothetical protein